jgi:16S rRNA processing protein RimM
MQIDRDLKLLGVFLKTHGVEGQLILKLFFFAEEELEKGEPVFVEIDGIPVPFFISDFRFLSDHTALVKLDEKDSSEEASEFVNCRVFVEREMPFLPEEADDQKYDRLRGFRVVDDKSGDTGTLQEIVIYPENPVMRIDRGGSEILVPFHDDIVRKIDYESCIITISAPEGLIDLFM